jgi:hypothetical protein
MTPDELGPEIRAIGTVVSLSFRTYKECPNPSSYATVRTVLAQTTLGLRNGSEVDFVWASTLAWAPLLVHHASMPFLEYFLVLPLVPNHNIIIR